MDEITDIKRRAGIMEFAPSPGFGSGGDGGGNSSVPMSERLEGIARSTQGVGQIDQHQIEEIFRAAQILKSMGQ
jgi:hypothetical protein